MNADVLRRAYAAIGESTPMRNDCGQLCGAACCAVDADGQGGVCLLEDEYAILKDVNWAKIEHDVQMDAPMLMCTSMCERDLRPFLCRIFPLCPVIGKSGKWTVRMDARARAVCPMSRGGLNGLDPEFVRNCANAVRVLSQDTEGEAFLRKWADIEVEFRKPLF